MNWEPGIGLSGCRIERIPSFYDYQYLEGLLGNYKYTEIYLGTRLLVYQRTHAVLPNYLPRYTYARHFKRLLHME